MNDFDQLIGLLGLLHVFLPPNYEARDDGLWEITTTPGGQTRERLVSHRLVVITKILTDSDDGGVHISLAWHDGVEPRDIVLPRNDAFSPRGLQRATRTGFPTASNLAARLVAYLAAFEAVNAASIPRATVATRLGWHGPDSFVWGKNVIGTGSVEVNLPCGVERLADGLSVKGNRDAWRDDIYRIAVAFPAVATGIYAALVPILLPRIPDSEGFTYELAGVTSGGKTTALTVAASVWGDPAKVIGTWDTTRVGVEGRLAVSGNLPLYLDDTAAIEDEAIVQQVLYDVTKGTGRSRGNINGGLRKTGGWKTVLLSTGEEAATSQATRGGARMRSVVFEGLPFRWNNPKTAKIVHHLRIRVGEHHGHLGPAVVRLLQRNASIDLTPKYREFQLAWAKRSKSPFAHRVAGHFALLELAGHLIEKTDMGRGVNPIEVLEPVWQSVMAGLQDVDPAVRALRKLRAWMSLHESDFWGRVSGMPQRSKWVGAWEAGSSWQEVSVLPAALEKTLGLDFRTDTIVRAWDSKGWLRRDGKNRVRPKVQVGKSRMRCVVIVRGAFLEIGEDEDMDAAQNTAGGGAPP